MPHMDYLIGDVLGLAVVVLVWVQVMWYRRDGKEL